MSRPRPFLVLLVALSVSGPVDGAAPPWRLVDRDGDLLPAGVVARLGTARWRHRDGFTRTALSTDGRWMVSAGDDHQAHLWEVSTGRLLRSADGQQGDHTPFALFAFQPRSSRLLSHDSSNTFYLWEIPAFRLARRWSGPTLTHLVVSSDDRLAGGFTQEGAVYVFDVRTGKGRTVLQAGSRRCDLAFTRSGDLVVLEHPSDRNFRAVRLDLVTGRTHKPLLMEACWAVLSPDGRHVATVSLDRKQQFQLWRVETGSRLALDVTPDVLEDDPEFDKQSLLLAFRPDGRGLVVRRRSPDALFVYDLDRGMLVDRVLVPEYPSGSIVWGFGKQLSSDGKIFFDVESNKVTRVNLRTSRPADDLVGFDEPVAGLAWSAGGHAVNAVTEAAFTRWEARTGRRLHPRNASDGTHNLGVLWGSVWALAPRGQTLAQVTPQDNNGEVAYRNITLTDCYSGKVIRTLRGHAAEVVALNFSGDGKQLISVDKAIQVRVWDVARGKDLHTLDASKTASDVKGALFSPDGSKALLIEHSGRVHLWDARTWKHLHTLRPAVENPPRDPDTSYGEAFADISPKGDLLITSYSGRLLSWDLSTFRERRIEAQLDPEVPNWLTGHFAGLSISSDGRYLACGEYGRVSLYEVASGRVVDHFQGPCSAVAFHPSCPRLAVSDPDRLNVLIWDLKSLFLSRGTDVLSTPPPSWSDLLDSDAGRAQRAAWALSVTPGMEALLSRELKAVARRDPDWLQRQIAALGSDRYAVRRKAEQVLTDAGDAAVPALERALPGAGDLEQRRRIKRVLDTRSSEWLREHRAILALEARGTPEARRLLERLAAGLPGARLTVEAKDALRRLRERP